MKKQSFLVPLIILIVWSLLAYTGLISPFFIAAPHEAFIKLFALILNGEMLKDIGWTLYRIFIGLFLGSAIGLLLGLLIGLFPKVWKYSQGTVDFFRSLPAFALFPLFILIFGPGDPAKIGTAAWFVAFIMLISTSYAVRGTNETRLRTSFSLGANKFQTFIYIVVPEGLPQLMVGFRNCLAFAPIVVIATEMFSGTQYGLGDRIYEARLVYKVPEMYAALIVSGIIGFGLNKLFLILIESKVHWSGK